MLARIYRALGTTTQSGVARDHTWTLAFEPAAARSPDPLMGWTETRDPDGLIRLNFPGKAQAVDYAQRRGLSFEVLPEPKKKTIIKAYADNFAFNRKQPWTH